MGKIESNKVTQSIIRHIKDQYSTYLSSECVFHFNKRCFTLLNANNSERYHCLYAYTSSLWKSYSEITKSCDIPEHFYDLIELNQLMGSEYVLPFVHHFRESSGYTIGLYKQDPDLYPPTQITRDKFKETFYAYIIFLCAVCQRLGGKAPNIKSFSFMYTHFHPVLCDIDVTNADGRERLGQREHYFNEKKWNRFMTRKTIRDVIRYTRIVFPLYFKKKSKENCCILRDESDDKFDGETHNLVCKRNKKSLIEVIQEFKHLMPNSQVRLNVIEKWL